MKIPCEIIDDLLPLYEDQVCNQTTKEAVRDHLQDCPRCRSRLTGTVLAEPVPVPEDPSREAAAAKKSFQKIKRRWVISVAAVLALAVLLTGVGYLFSRGITPDHWENIQFTSQFAQYLCDGEFYKASEMIPYPYQTEYWTEYNRQEFVDAMTACKEQGIYFTSREFDWAEYSGGYFRFGLLRYYPEITSRNYYFDVTIHLSSGDTIDAELYLEMEDGKLSRIQIFGSLTPDIQTLEEALEKSDLPD